MAKKHVRRGGWPRACRHVSMTIHPDQVAQLLVELGERTPRIESIVQEADAPRWAIELEDGHIVLAELDEERGRLSLETDLGRPPEEHRLATCEALMMLTSLEHAANIGRWRSASRMANSSSVAASRCRTPIQLICNRAFSPSSTKHSNGGKSSREEHSPMR